MEAIGVPERINRLISGRGISTSSSFDNAAYLQFRCDSFNANQGALTGYDCPLCKNRGCIAEVRHNAVTMVRCSCMDARNSIQRAEASGLKDLLQIYTLDRFQTVEPWQAAAKRTAEKYLQEQKGWFVMSGAVGSGKSHLCVAICGELLKQGRSVQYLMWRDQIRALKSYDGDMDERSDQLRKYKTADVLYIDDFLKCGKNEVPTKADTDVALEILMARYNQTDKLTVISTERSISELLELDEALGSRIYERSKGFCLRNTGTDKNWRLRRED